MPALSTKDHGTTISLRISLDHIRRSVIAGGHDIDLHLLDWNGIVPWVGHPDTLRLQERVPGGIVES